MGRLVVILDHCLSLLFPPIIFDAVSFLSDSFAFDFLMKIFSFNVHIC